MGSSLPKVIVISFLLFGSLYSANEASSKIDFDLNDVMNLASILGMGESGMLHDASVTFHQETELLYTLMSGHPDKKRKKPEGNGRSPLNIETKYTIDHVEPLDQDEESMTVHGSVTLKWIDPLYVWEPEKFNKIHVISRSLNEFITSFRPWTPSVYFKTADPADQRRADVGDGYTTILTVKYTGEIIMHKKFSVKSSCDFNYRDFPYDTQRCMLIMTSQHNFREVWFSDDRNQKKHSVRQLKQERNSPMIGDFVLDYIHVFNTIMKSDVKPVQLKGPWKEGDAYVETSKMASVITLSFTRISSQFLYGFSLPLVLCSIIAQASLFFDTKKGFLFIAIPLLYITCQMGIISQRFPSDADGTPLLVVMHYVGVAQVIACFTGLIALVKFFGAKAEFTLLGNAASKNNGISEATARILFMIFNLSFLITITMGSLYFGGWNYWEDDS